MNKNILEEGIKFHRPSLLHACMYLLVIHKSIKHIGKYIITKIFIIIIYYIFNKEIRVQFSE